MSTHKPGNPQSGKPQTAPQFATVEQMNGLSAQIEEVMKLLSAGTPQKGAAGSTVLAAERVPESIAGGKHERDPAYYYKIVEKPTPTHPLFDSELDTRLDEMSKAFPGQAKWQVASEDPRETGNRRKILIRCRKEDFNIDMGEAISEARHNASKPVTASGSDNPITGVAGAAGARTIDVTGRTLDTNVLLGLQQHGPTQRP